MNSQQNPVAIESPRSLGRRWSRIRRLQLTHQLRHLGSHLRPSPEPQLSPVNRVHQAPLQLRKLIRQPITLLRHVRPILGRCGGGGGTVTDGDQLIIRTTGNNTIVDSTPLVVVLGGVRRRFGFGFGLGGLAPLVWDPGIGGGVGDRGAGDEQGGRGSEEPISRVCERERGREDRKWFAGIWDFGEEREVRVWSGGEEQSHCFAWSVWLDCFCFQQMLVTSVT